MKELSTLITDITKRYPTKRAAILPSLWAVHDRFGWITPEAVSIVSKMLEISEPEVKETASFYKMFSLKPLGKIHIQLCRGLCCKLKDAGLIADYISSKTGAADGCSSEDGKFHFSTVECLGACGNAPVMQIDNDYYDDLTSEKIDEILKRMLTG